jgi:glucose-1-phosphate adenylyltransferase
MNDTWVGPGATVDQAVVDKQVVVGAGAYLGWGDDMRPNERLPDRLNAGITVVGKDAHIPSGARIGRNVLVDADVDESDFAPYSGKVVASGATVAPVVAALETSE